MKEDASEESIDWIVARHYRAADWSSGRWWCVQRECKRHTALTARIRLPGPAKKPLKLHSERPQSGTATLVQHGVRGPIRKTSRTNKATLLVAASGTFVKLIRLRECGPPCLNCLLRLCER